MLTGLKAALAYFAIVFAAGFALGTLRVLAVAPYLGGEVAVLVELPVMLAVSWIACRRVIAFYSVPARWSARLAMGGLAFVVLMIAELLLGLFLLGRTMSAHFEAYRAVEALVGLAGQLVFASFPLVEMRWHRQPERHR